MSHRSKRVRFEDSESSSDFGGMVLSPLASPGKYGSIFRLFISNVCYLIGQSSDDIPEVGSSPGMVLEPLRSPPTNIVADEDMAMSPPVISPVGSPDGGIELEPLQSPGSNASSSSEDMVLEPLGSPSAPTSSPIFMQLSPLRSPNSPSSPQSNSSPASARLVLPPLDSPEPLGLGLNISPQRCDNGSLGSVPSAGLLLPGNVSGRYPSEDSLSPVGSNLIPLSQLREPSVFRQGGLLFQPVTAHLTNPLSSTLPSPTAAPPAAARLDPWTARIQAMVFVISSLLLWKLNEFIAHSDQLGNGE